MSIKATPVNQDLVVEQAKSLGDQKAKLEIQAEVLERKLEMIKASLAENEELRTKNKELLQEVMKQFEIEWTRRAEFYPNIRLGILTSAAALNAPASPKKEG